MPYTAGMDRPSSDKVQWNEDGTLTKETIKRAMKALRKRLKLARLDDESKLGGDALTGGVKSSICAVKPPEQYPLEVWDELVRVGRLRKLDVGLYEIVEVGGA